MTNDAKLEPCPFCGGVEIKIRSNGIGDFYAICQADELEDISCGASTSDRSCETEQGAVDRWNRRATPSAETQGSEREAIARIDEYASRGVEDLGIGEVERLLEAASFLALRRPAAPAPVAGLVTSVDEDGKWREGADEPPLPCPWCGTTHLLTVEPLPENGFLVVKCRKCGASGRSRLANRAVEAQTLWNDRAALTAGAEPEAVGKRLADRDSLTNATTPGHPDAFLNVLLDYTAGFYGAAREAGMPASKVADAMNHVERAARGLHSLAMAGAEPRADDEMFGVTGACDEVEALACAIWAHRCPGLLMDEDHDRPHYMDAARAAFSTLDGGAEPRATDAGEGRAQAALAIYRESGDCQDFRDAVEALRPAAPDADKPRDGEAVRWIWDQRLAHGWVERCTPAKPPASPLIRNIQPLYTHPPKPDARLSVAVEALERIKKANPRSTNSGTAAEMHSWTSAVAGEALRQIGSTEKGEG